MAVCANVHPFAKTKQLAIKHVLALCIQTRIIDGNIRSDKLVVGKQLIMKMNESIFDIEPISTLFTIDAKNKRAQTKNELI